jgi:transcription elongation factor Elf1
MRSLKCLLGGHDWHSEYDHESRRTSWTCRRCGHHKVTVETVDDVVDKAGGGYGNVNLYGGGG